MYDQCSLYSGECRQQQDERRHASLRSLVYALFMTRRRSRRCDADTISYYSDNYGPYIFSGAVMMMLLCVCDAFFTLQLLQHGSTELNPVLAWALDQNVLLFFGLKYVVTAAGVVLMVMHKHFRFFGIYGHHLLLICLVGYAILIQYQVVMLVQVN